MADKFTGNMAELHFPTVKVADLLRQREQSGGILAPPPLPEGDDLEEAYDDSKHPRGHQGNPGQFAKKGEGGAKKEKPGKTLAPKGKAAREPAPKPPTPTAAQSAQARSNAGRNSSLIGNENESRLASALGPGHERLPDSEPLDVVHKDATGLEHGFEVKTLLTNKSGHIHMSAAQQARKEAWVKGKLIGITDRKAQPDPAFDPASRRVVHVVVIDHREAYHDSMVGTTDFAKRALDAVYYARHPRAWDVAQMVKADNLAALKTLQHMPEAEYKKVFRDFGGKSYPSGEAHPVVSRIAGEQSVEQLRQLHAERKAKLDQATTRHERHKARHAELETKAEAARKAARNARETGHVQAPALRQKAAQLRRKRDLARRDVVRHEKIVAVRQKKLASVAGQLQARGETP